MPAPAPATGPRVLKVEGEGTVDGAPATAGMPLKPTSVITTGPHSKIVITLEPGSLIQVREQARVELGKSPRKERSLKLLAGALWSFLPKGSSYEVVGSNAVAGARGTIFYFEEKKENDAYLCACDGDVEMTVGRKSKTLESKMQHIGMAVRGADKKAKPTAVKKVLNHTKEEAQALEAMRTSAQ